MAGKLEGKVAVCEVALLAPLEVVVKAVPSFGGALLDQLTVVVSKPRLDYFVHDPIRNFRAFVG